MENTCHAHCQGPFAQPLLASPPRHVRHSDCVIDTLEGPGISTSQCPACATPSWKNDLRFNHVLNNVVEHVGGLQRRMGLRARLAALQAANRSAQQVAGLDSASAAGPVAALPSGSHPPQSPVLKQQQQQQHKEAAPQLVPPVQPQKHTMKQGEEQQHEVQWPQQQQQQQHQQQQCLDSQSAADLGVESDPTTPELRFGPAWQAKV